jgi:predicted transposase YdaD
MAKRKPRRSFEEVFTEAGIIPEWKRQGGEEKALEIARNLLSEGLSVEQTAKLATLPVEKVRAL